MQQQVRRKILKTVSNWVFGRNGAGVCVKSPAQFFADDSVMSECLKLAEIGISTFPVHSIKVNCSCTCGRDGKFGGPLCDKIAKHPISSLINHYYEKGEILQKSWKELVTSDPVRVREYFRLKPYANYAIDLMSSDMFVLDFDNKVYEGPVTWLRGKTGPEIYEEIRAKFPEAFRTVTVRTGSGGYHVFFRQQADEKIQTCKVIEPIFEIKSFGGYVLGPGSRHKSGNRYEYVEGHEFGKVSVLAVPDELIVYLKKIRISGDGLRTLDTDTYQRYHYLGRYSVQEREKKVDMSVWGGAPTPDQISSAERWLQKYTEDPKVHYRNNRAWLLAIQLRDDRIPYLVAKQTMIRFVDIVNTRTLGQPDFHPYAVNRGIIQLINAYTSEPRDRAMEYTPEVPEPVPEEPEPEAATSGPCSDCRHLLPHDPDADGAPRGKCSNKQATAKNRVIRRLDQVRSEGCFAPRVGA